MNTFRLIVLPLFFVFNLMTFGQAQSSLVEGKPLQKDSLLADMAILEKALTSTHPGIYRYNRPEDIQEVFGQLRNQVYDGISEAEFMKVLAQTIVKVRCGHTYLNPWNMRRELRERLFGGDIYFPVGFRIIEGRFYATHNASGEEGIRPGAEILSINGVSTETIYDSLSTIAKTDGNNLAPVDHYLSLRNYKVGKWQAFDLYFPLFFPLVAPQFTIQYRNFGERKKRAATVDALSKKARSAIMKERYGDKVLDNEAWSVGVINSNLAVMRLGTFAIWNWKDFDQVQWFKQAFEKLKGQGVPNLIVDIRGNGGGLGEPRDELISYLIDEKIECGEQGTVLIRTTKLDPELVPHSEIYNEFIINGLPEAYYTRRDDGFFALKEEFDCQTIDPKPERYQGQVYIFGGPSNVSATYTFLDRANRFGYAKYVGQPSGGNQQGINGGEYVFFYLPYSKMEVDIPLKFFAPAGERPDAGVEPQVLVPVTQEDIALGRDPWLEYVKKMVDK